MSIEDFVQAHINNLKAGMKSPYFDMVRALESTYRSAIGALPPDGVPLIFGRFLLVCDKAMRSAALLIAARQPEDSVAITRRAIEAAKTALAIKVQDDNAMNWLAAEDRLARWAARQQNEKPQFFTVRLENIKGDPLINELDKFLGIVSDAYVHFTPEFYSSLAWDVKVNEDNVGGYIFLNYFHTDEREIERHYTMLAAVHTRILDAFDRSLDHILSKNNLYQKHLNAFRQIAKELNQQYQDRYSQAPAEQSLGET